MVEALPHCSPADSVPYGTVSHLTCSHLLRLWLLPWRIGMSEYTYFLSGVLEYPTKLLLEMLTTDIPNGFRLGKRACRGIKS